MATMIQALGVRRRLMMLVRSVEVRLLLFWALWAQSLGLYSCVVADVLAIAHLFVLLSQSDLCL